MNAQRHKDMRLCSYRWSLESRLTLVLLGCCFVVAAGMALVFMLPLPGWLPPTAAGVCLVGIVVLFGRRWLVESLHPLRSLGNVIEAVRLGDYSLRVRTDRDGIIRELATDINKLSAAHRDRAQTGIESKALISKLVSALPQPWLVFDELNQLILANPAAGRLLGSQPAVGIAAETLGLTALLATPSGHTVQLVLPGSIGRYVVHREPFREQGIRYTLLILVEVETALRNERQRAWESLVRVLAHEINNSLTPIKSITETLIDMLQNKHMLSAAELLEQLQRISHRAASLVTFVHGYASIARLPQPKLQVVQIDQLVRHCIDLQPQAAITCSGDALTIRADPVLLEQALINLLKNAFDAASGVDAVAINIDWHYQSQHEQPGLLISITDNGQGLAAEDNLFVPFFTTKPGGSGVGLLLARRIAELHAGKLELRNRDDASGAVAELWLPVNSKPESN